MGYSLHWVSLFCLTFAAFTPGASAAPARFWLSSSPTDPLASINDSGSLELSLAPAATLGAGLEHSLYLWMQPQTKSSGEFQQLVTLSLNVVSTAPLVDFRSILIDNPRLDAAGNPDAGGNFQRFASVRDSSFADPLNGTLALSSLAPQAIGGGTADRWLGLSANNFEIDNPPVGMGLGPDCHPNDASCQEIADYGAAWRLATMNVAPINVLGDVSIHLQIGEIGMLHANGYTSQTNVIFAPPGFEDPAYNAGINGHRGTTHFATDAPDALLHIRQPLQGDFNGDDVVNLADYTVWRDNLGGMYNASHYLLWKQNFGETLVPLSRSLYDSTTVPEPASTLACLVAALAIVHTLRRHRTASKPLLGSAGIWSTLFLVATLGQSPDAYGVALIFEDDFDGYTSQGEFESHWTAVGSNPVAPSALLAVGSADGDNAVYVPGNASPSLNGLYRNRNSFLETGKFATSGNLGIGDKLTWSFDFYDTQPAGTGAASQPQRNYVSLQDSFNPTGVNQLVSMGTNNNRLAGSDGGNFYMARILGYTPSHLGAASGDFFKLNDEGAPFRTQGWNNLTVEISTSDELSTDYRFYVNNTLAKTVLGIGNASQIRSYDNIAIGSGLTNANTPAYFDNMRVEFDSFGPPEHERNLWRNPDGGEFELASNWYSDVVPYAAQLAIFHLNSTGYTVTASSSIHAPSLVAVKTDRVTFDFGAAHWDSTSFIGDLFLANQAGDVGELKVISGDLVFANFRVGHNGGTGSLLLDGTSTRLGVQDTGLLSNNNGISVGLGGNGYVTIATGATLAVEAGTGVDPSRMVIGSGTNGTGLLRVIGTGSTLETEGLTIGEYDGNGTVQITEGAEATLTGAMYIGDEVYNHGRPDVAEGQLIVDGVNSTVTSTQQVQAGRFGAHGTITIRNGGSLHTAAGASASGSSGIIATLNARSRSRGDVLITGTGSQWINDGLLVVGWEGDANVVVEQGGYLRSQHAQMGRTSTAVAAARVTGTGSTWDVVENLTIGGTESAPGGWATLEVSAGGVVSVGSAIQLHAGGTLKGHGGTVIGNVSNSGRVAPGNSPGILTIDGNYTQSQTGTLEIEFGGLTPGPTGHDQLVVTGTATLGGRLEVPMYDLGNGFIPSIEDEIVILTADSRVGSFDVPIAPNLAQFNSAKGTNLAFQTVYGPDSVKVRVVERSTGIQFESVFEEADWSDPDSWKTKNLPSELNIVGFQNLYQDGAQVVNVDVASAVVNQLSVSDPDEAITIRVETGNRLTSQTEVFVGTNAAVLLEADSSLHSGVVTFDGGGTLGGNGEINANQTIVEAGVLRPGFSVGKLNFTGDVELGGNAKLEIEITGENTGDHHDSMRVSGNLQLSGKLEIDLSSLDAGTFTPGMSYEIATVDGSLSGSFDHIEVLGRDDVYFAASYGVGNGQLAALTTGTRVTAAGYYLGDATQDGEVDEIDAQILAAILMDSSLGEFQYMREGELHYAAANFLDAFDFYRDGAPTGVRIVDFDDIRGFAQMLSRHQGISLSAAYGTINDAIEAAAAQRVPEPSTVVLGVLATTFLLRRQRRAVQATP